MKLIFVDSRGQKEVVCEANDVADMIEPMMNHKARRHIYSSGPFSLPGTMEKNSCYILNQESNGVHYEVVNDETSNRSFHSPVCDICNTPM